MMAEDTLEHGKWRARIIAYAPFLLWTLVVLGFSTGAASSEETSIIIRPILKFLFPSTPDASIDLYHGYIRKCAHFTEYWILGALTVRAFAASSANLLKNHRYGLSAIFVLAIACADEYHQSFEPSRTSSPYDVMIDVAGGTAAAIVLYVISRIHTR